MEKEFDTKELKTMIRFKESEKNGELIGFASWDKKSKRLWGVTEESKYKKRICILSKEVKQQENIKPGILYNVTLVISDDKKSYIVKKAEVMQFKARVETQIVSKCFYQCIINFGCKTIYYNPFDGESEYSRVLDCVLELLNAREDIKNKEETIEAVRRSARVVNKYMEADGYIVPKKKKAV